MTSSIDPLLPPVDPGPPPPSSPPVFIPPSSPGPSDSITTFSGPTTNAALTAALNVDFTPVLDLPDITILEFSRTVNTAINDSNAQVWDGQQKKATSLKGLYTSGIAEGLSLLQLFQQMMTISAELARIYNQDQENVNQLNQTIDDYNTNQVPQDQDAIDQMNQAINDYNKAVDDLQHGRITQAQFDQATTDYNSAVGVYNNYVASRGVESGLVQLAIANFNAQSSVLNAQLTVANNLTEGTAIPQSTLQDTYTGNTSIPGAPPSPPPAFPGTVSLLPNTQPLSHVQNTIQPPVTSYSTYVNQIFVPLFQALFFQLALTRTFATVFSNFNEYVQFISLGKIATVPPAFTTPLPEVFIGGGSSSTTGSGSGVALGMMVATLTNPVMAGLLDRSKFNAEVMATIDPYVILSRLQLFSTQFLRQTGLNSVGGVFGKLSNGDAQSAVNAALGLAFANQISLAISSGSIKEAIQGLLTQLYPNLSANSLNELTAKLTSATQLFFLEVAISQIAQVTKNPKLFGQIIASLGGDNVLNTIQGLKLLDVLGNQLSVAYLKESLANSIQSQNVQINEQQAQQIANDVINNVLQQQNITQDQLNASIIAALINQGFTESQAIASASAANTFIQAEVQSNYLLDTALKTDSLNRDLLASRLSSQNIADNVVLEAITAALKEDSLTNRELRDRLSRELINRGVDQNSALLASTFAVLGPPAPQEPVTPTTVDNLKTELNRSVLQSLADANGAQAKDLTSQILATLLGGESNTVTQRSLRDLLADQLNSLQKLDNANVSNAIDDQLRDFNKPNVNLFTFTKELMDPASFLVHSVWTGIMYDRPVPPSLPQHPGLLV